jgi:putative ABC transport system substrate-binding protein
MKRREFVVCLCAFGIPSSTSAQSARAFRIGYLTTSSILDEARPVLDMFIRGMLELGHKEGDDVVFIFRSVDSDVARFDALATELVDLRPNVIVATNSSAGRAAMKATSSIPIVVPVMGDPIGDGFVKSLARPDRNVTGLSFLGPQLLPKRLSLLKEALPEARRIAALWHPEAYGEETMRDMTTQVEQLAQKTLVTLVKFAVRGPGEFEAAYSGMAEARVDALIIYPSPMLFTERKRIVDLATKHRLAAMTMGREFVELGALMSFGASIGDLHRRAARYVDQIMRGAKPAELPIQLPTEFEFALNLRTARTLGIVMPASIIAQATQIIE